MKSKMKNGLKGKSSFDHNSVRSRFANAVHNGMTTEQATAIANNTPMVAANRDKVKLSPPPAKPKKKKAKRPKKPRAPKKPPAP